MTDTPLIAPAWSVLVNELTGERTPIADREAFVRDLRNAAAQDAAAPSVAAVSPAPTPAPPQAETGESGDDAKPAIGKEARK